MSQPTLSQPLVPTDLQPILSNTLLTSNQRIKLSFFNNELVLWIKVPGQRNSQRQYRLHSGQKPIQFQKVSGFQGCFNVLLPPSGRIALSKPERIGSSQGKNIYFAFWIKSLGTHADSPKHINYTFYEKD